MSEEKTERNIKIYLAWMNGVSITRLSIRYKIKDVTVRNIVKRYDAKRQQGLLNLDKL